MDVDIAVGVEATAGVTVDTEMDVCPTAAVVGDTATDADTCVDAAVDVDETMALACCCCCRAGATESALAFSAPTVPLVLVLVLLIAAALVVVVVEAVVGVEVGGIEVGVVRGTRYAVRAAITVALSCNTAGRICGCDGPVAELAFVVVLELATLLVVGGGNARLDVVAGAGDVEVEDEAPIVLGFTSACAALSSWRFRSSSHCCLIGSGGSPCCSRSRRC